jgi:DNA polymerase III gamma/tau subunit
MAYAGDEISDAQVRELLGVVSESVLDDLVEAITSQSAELALGLVHRLLKDGQSLQHFCREAIRHFRNLLVVRVCGADSELVAAPKDERAKLAEHAAKFSEEDLTRFFNILLETDDDLRRKPDPRLHLELGLLRLINAQRLAPLEELLADMRGDVRPARTTPAAPGRPSESAAATPAVSVSSSGAAAVRMAPAIEKESPATPPATPVVRAASNLPIPASPPRIVARAVETAAGGLGSAQLEAIKGALQSSRLLSSFLEHATRSEIEAGEFRLFFSPENRTLTEMLPREAMERLRTAVQEVIGQPLRVCVKLESGRAAMGRSSELRAKFEEDPIVRAMLEKFGGQISKVKRPGEE